MIGTAPAALTGFTPNVVLRESQVEERPDTLAAISQANLRGVRDGITQAIEGIVGKKVAEVNVTVKDVHAPSDDAESAEDTE